MLRNYDTWKTGYNDSDYEPEYHCKDCKKKDDKINNAKEFLSAIVEQLYASDKLDTSLLEFQLDELCHYLDVPMVKGDLQIERKKNKIHTFIDDWKSFNTASLTAQEAKTC